MLGRVGCFFVNQGIPSKANSWKFSSVIAQNQPTPPNGSRGRLVDILDTSFAILISHHGFIRFLLAILSQFCGGFLINLLTEASKYSIGKTPPPQRQSGSSYWAVSVTQFGSDYVWLISGVILNNPRFFNTLVLNTNF